MKILKSLSFLFLIATSLSARSPNVEVKTNWDRIDKHMDIDLERRATDWVESFQALRQEQPDSNIYAIIQGQSLDDIVHMELLPNSSLIKVTYFGNHHTRTRIVKAEEIEELGHRSLNRPKVRLYWPDSTNRYEP